jgi:FkbM family methyltransferase
MGIKGAVRGGLGRAVRSTRIRDTVQRATLTGRVPPAVWKRLPVAGDQITVRGRDGSFLYGVHAGDPQLRPLQWRGTAGLEPETLAILPGLVQDAKVMVDVGANTGVFTLLALRLNPSLRVEAFEPVDRIRAALLDNLHRNVWGHRVTVHECALSNVSGEVEFILPEIPMPTSAHLAAAAYRSHSGKRIMIPSLPLDDAVDSPVDLVKIDVEGAEDRVLAGMTRILTEDRPTIIVECLPEGPHRRVQSILEAHDYRFAHLRANGPNAVRTIVPDVGRTHRNFLCTPAL